MFPMDDEESEMSGMEMDMGQYSGAGEPMPAEQPLVGMRQFYSNQLGMGLPSNTTVSPEELADLLGPALGEGYSDYGGAPAMFGGEGMGMDEEANPNEMEPDNDVDDPNELLSDINAQPIDPEQVKKDVRAILLKRAQDRMALSEAYQDQSDELGEY